MFLRALVELSWPDGDFVSFIDQHSAQEMKSGGVRVGGQSPHRCR
jgi:hypothetical protein